nr:hypothetical protein [Streptomyces sp. RLB3-6]
MFALTGAKADERETLRDMFDTAPDVLAVHPGQTIIGDKNYFGREFERGLAERHLKLLRPARKREAEPAGSHLFKPLRQVIGIPPWIPPPSGGGGNGLLRSRAGKADSPPGRIGVHRQRPAGDW